MVLSSDFAELAFEPNRMIDLKLIALLRCPSDGSQLELASETAVHEVNARIEAGQARTVDDEKVTTPIDSGLVSSRSQRVYPIRGGIATLIASEAIAAPDLSHS